MRMPWLVVLAVAVGGCSTGEGTVLELTTGGTTLQADHVDVVLASAEGVRVDTQHTDYTGFEAKEAIYFLQRAAGGTFTSDDPRTTLNVDGFRIRLEANPDLVDERTLAPIVLAYDAQGGLLAVGAQSGTNTADPSMDGVPLPVVIESGKLVKYIVPMTLVGATPATGAAVTLDHALSVTCGDPDARFTSGVAFRITATGPEVRVLLPLLGAANTDASNRDLDLDCDLHDADVDDCDDLHDDVYKDRPLDAGESPMCDGVDRTCRGEPTFGICDDGSTGCHGLGACNPDGVGVVDDTCLAGPACLCANNSTTCARCVLQFEPAGGGGNVKPCDPSRSLFTPLHVPTCNGDCDAQVYASAGWEAKIADAFGNMDDYEETLNDVHEQLLLQLRHNGPPIGHDPSIGSVFLRVTHHDATSSVDVYALDLQLGTQGCAENGDPTPMACNTNEWQ